MSESTPRLPARPSFEQLQKQAKELLRLHRAGDAAALERFRAASPRQPHTTAETARTPTLADAQFVLAREYGFNTWAALKQHVAAQRPGSIEQYHRLAKELAEAYLNGNAMAIREINWRHGAAFVCDFHEPIEMQRHLTSWFAAETKTPELAEADTRRMVAHSLGFDSWESFLDSVKQPPRHPRSAPIFRSNRPPFYEIDWKENKLNVTGPQSDTDWATIAELMREHRIAKLEAPGMSDAGMRRICRLEHVIHLDIGGSKELTDDGVQRLASMPQLEHLDFGGWTSGLTDRALEPLRHLANLKRFEMRGAQGITDAGLANLACCEQLENVNLLGTATGNGAIRALAGKRHLRHLHTGRLVTDDGLKLFHEYPVFKTWQGGEIRYGLMGAGCEPNQLSIAGVFTDAGVAQLAGLDGVFGLSFSWHGPSFTAAGLAVLRQLPNLAVLGCDGRRLDDAAMREIAAFPRLRMLMGQGSVATDAGFEALSRSATLEYFWGRECDGFTSRGFTAFSTMPALRGLAVSCQNVDDAALALLPRFPALRVLAPMYVPDAGFRHIGLCEHLEALYCMYCRETGDAATEHIAPLSLKTYYAGMTTITDRSLEILGEMQSLEQVRLWACAGLTNAGVMHLTALPNLREVELGGLPNVTRNVVEMFPDRVRVLYEG